jgi:hypothetical protein
VIGELAAMRVPDRRRADDALRRRSSAIVVSQAAAAAKTAAETVSTPCVPTSKAEKSTDAKSRRVTEAMPAAVPTATASVGDTSRPITASVAAATPRKIAGKTGPPRKPQPRQIA